jgi:hypothetical protein
MKTKILFAFILLFNFTTFGQGNTNSCKFITISGAKILKHSKANLLNANRGNEYKFLTFDINQDGKQDFISYWLSTSLGQQRINTSFGYLIEEEDFYKQDDSEIWAFVLSVPNEKLPLVMIYYNGSDKENPLESSVYLFKLVNGKFQLFFDSKLSYGQFPDRINFTNKTLEDSYGTGGLFEEHKFTLK